VYLIRASAIDGVGNRSSACCTVVVPREPTAAGLAIVGSAASAAQAACNGTGTIPLGFVRVGDGPVLGPKQ
jgi:hypothetical protein